MKKRLSLLLAMVCIVGTLVAAMAVSTSAAETGPYVDTTRFATTLTNGEGGFVNADDDMRYYTLLAGRSAYIKYAYNKIPSTDYLSFNTYVDLASVLATGFQIQIGENANAQSSATLLADGAGIQTDLDYYYDEYSTGTLQIRTYSGSNRYDVIQIRGGQVIKSSKYFEAVTEGSDATYTLPGYGWHRITTFVRQTTEVVEGAPSYSVTVDVYANGEKIMSLKPKASYLTGACYYTATVADGVVTAAEPKSYYIQAYNSNFYGENGISSSTHGMLRFRAPKTAFAPLSLEVKPIKYDYAGGALVKTGSVPMTEQYLAGQGGTGNGWFFQPYVSADGEFFYSAYANTLQHFSVTGSAAVLPTPVKTGNTFLGWFDKAGNAVTGSTLPANGEIVAHYSDEGDYTLTVSNKGEVTTSKPTQNTFVLGNESAYWLVDGAVKAAGETVTLTGDTTVYALAVELLDGASVRLDETNPGLRFETVIDKALYEALSELDFTVGTLVIPTDVLGSTEFTEDALSDEDETFLSLTSNQAGAKLVSNANGDYSFYAAVVNLKNQNYARRFSAISYIELDGVRVYTDYSEKVNARSIYEVATAAFLGSYSDNATIKGYLDKVIKIDASLTAKSTISGYTTPYEVSWASNVLTIEKLEGSFTSADEIATVILDGRVYTGGWTLASGKLTASYVLGYREDFEDATEETVVNDKAIKFSLTHNTFKITASTKAIIDGLNNDDSTQTDAAEIAKQTLISVKEAGKSLGYVKLYYGQQEKPGDKGQIYHSGNLKSVVGDCTKVSYTLSMMKLGTGTPSVTYQFRGTKADGSSTTDNRLAIFKIAKNGTITVKDTVVGYVALNEFNDYTFTIDLVKNTVAVYINGEYITTVQDVITIKDAYKTSDDMTILDWVKAYGTSYFANATDMQNENSGAAGICFDNLIIRAHN